MGITRNDAMTCHEFHENHEPAGKIYAWRRNGATQTWKTRPEDYRLPVKYGLRSYDAITPASAHLFHRADQCPTRHVRVTMPDNAGEWFGIVIADFGSGVTRVQVTTRGPSKHRVGSQVDVGTVNVTDL
jgi:hypothetical protein